MQKKIVKRIKRKSQKQESKVANDMGGRVLPGSGAIEGMKGDARTSHLTEGTFNDSDYLVENKFTESDGYVLNRKTWEKIQKEALRDGMRIPIMQIDVEPTPYEKYSFVIQEIDPDFNHIPLGMYTQAKRSKHITKDIIPSPHERTLIHFGEDCVVELVDYQVFLSVKFPRDVRPTPTPEPVPERPKTGKELAQEIVW